MLRPANRVQTASRISTDDRAVFIRRTVLPRRSLAAVRIIGLCLAVVLVVGLVASASAAANDAVMAWGYNYWGELGTGTKNPSKVPAVVCEVGWTIGDSCSSGPFLSGVTAVSAGWDHTLALLNNGTVAAWGRNETGDVGDGKTEFSLVPVAVSSLTGAAAVSGGQFFSVALLSNGTAMAWGDNVLGELGDATTSGPEKCESEPCSRTPVAVSGLSGATAVSAGGHHSLALLSGGTVVAWGDNESGELGNGTRTTSDVPVAVKGLSEVTAISAGGYHSMALLKNGTVMVWGDNPWGQLGNGATGGFSDVPEAVKGLSEVIAVSAGETDSFALLKNGTVMAWGENFWGQLGDGTETTSNVPVAVKGLSGATAVSAGWHNSLALLSNGTVMAWGENGDALGDGNEANSDVPVAVSKVSGATAVSGGAQDGLALVSDSPPTVATDAASSISQTSATLNATVNPNGVAVSECKLEYGTTVAYGHPESCSALPGSGNSPVAVSTALTGLSADTQYHFRIVATSAGGTTYGSDETFQTLALASHWLKKGKELAKGGPRVTVETSGALTFNLPQGLDGGTPATITCKLKDNEEIWNPVGTGAGEDEVTSFVLSRCKSTPALCPKPEKLEVITTYLEGPSVLLSGPPIRDELHYIEWELRCSGKHLEDINDNGELRPEVGNSVLSFGAGSGTLYTARLFEVTLSGTDKLKGKVTAVLE